MEVLLFYLTFSMNWSDADPLKTTTVGMCLQSQAEPSTCVLLADPRLLTICAEAR